MEVRGSGGLVCAASKMLPGAPGLCLWEREHWPVKVAVRLVCAFDCSVLSKEDLTLKRDLILGLGY